MKYVSYTDGKILSVKLLNLVVTWTATRNIIFFSPEKRSDTVKSKYLAQIILASANFVQVVLLRTGWTLLCFPPGEGNCKTFSCSVRHSGTKSTAVSWSGGSKGNFGMETVIYETTRQSCLKLRASHVKATRFVGTRTTCLINTTSNTRIVQSDKIRQKKKKKAKCRLKIWRKKNWNRQASSAHHHQI